MNMLAMNKNRMDASIQYALNEDIHRGDITTMVTISPTARSEAQMVAKEDGVICGLHVAQRVFELLGNDVAFKKNKEDGDKVVAGQVVAQLEGNTTEILMGERVALNYLQRMSGIASLTRKFCDLIVTTKARIVDTRKTLPGLRIFDKYSVVCGGGHNHRYGLSDGVLIKDNHIKACGSIKNALNTARASLPHISKIEIEVTTLSELKEALAYKADIVMLDNMSLAEMTECVRYNDKQALLEASGNVSLQTVFAIAQTGVDIISVGALTHSVSALDISLKIHS